MNCTIDYNLKRHVLYLLNFSVCWNGSLRVSLVFEPRADSLQRSISTAPAIVIYPILHIVMITIYALDHIHLHKKNEYSKILTLDAHILQTHLSQVYSIQSQTVPLVPYKNAFKERQFNIIFSWLFTKCPKPLPKDIRPIKCCMLASSPTSSPTTLPCCWLCFRLRCARENLISEPYGILCLEYSFPI